jgi:hypothetical protein
VSVVNISEELFFERSKLFEESIIINHHQSSIMVEMQQNNRYTRDGGREKTTNAVRGQTPNNGSSVNGRQRFARLFDVKYNNV